MKEKCAAGAWATAQSAQCFYLEFLQVSWFWSRYRTRTPRRSARPPSGPRGSWWATTRTSWSRPTWAASPPRWTGSCWQRPCTAQSARRTATPRPWWTGARRRSRRTWRRAWPEGGQWSDHFERAAGAYNVRPHKTVYGAPEDVEKQPVAEFRLLQDNADKFQQHKELTDRRVKAVVGGRSERPPTRRASSTRTAATCSGRPWTP